MRRYVTIAGWNWDDGTRKPTIPNHRNLNSNPQKQRFGIVPSGYSDSSNPRKRMRRRRDIPEGIGEGYSRIYLNMEESFMIPKFKYIREGWIKN